MMKRLVCALALAPLAALADAVEPPLLDDLAQEVLPPRPAVKHVVPESYVSKAWTVRLEEAAEMRVTFWRPDVFRIEKGLKVADTNATTQTEISATGQYVTTTNTAYTVAYADPRNDEKGAQIILPEVREDASRVRFEDGAASYTWRTTALTLTLDKASGTFACALADGTRVWTEAAPVAIRTAAANNGTDITTLALAHAEGTDYFGGGQQNGSFIHTGKTIDIVADCNWAEGGHPNPAPWMLARVDKGVYYGILRHTFSPGRYDFSQPGQATFSHNETRFDAFFFAGTSFNQILDRYTELTGRPNFIPVWGLELGDADAWMTRDKDTREPKQNDDLTYVETTPDVVARNAEKYRAEDMPCGWLLVNDGYGCKYMQLAWVVEALRGLGFRTGLWTAGALDRINWEVGTAGTRVQKIDVAWSGPAYQHGLNCNKTAYDGFINNSDARAFIWTCQGWAGTQRYGVCWTGDQYGNFDLIRYHIPTITGSGMSGQAYATTDIDGIFGGSNESYVRDLQWKCFTPALYVMNGWSDVNKAPWSYPEPYKSIIRDWLKWKLRMTPYMYTTCREAWETGAPIDRPLVWNYPDDPNCRSEAVNYEMMLGRDILIAPVFESMEESRGWCLRNIYLPEGTWYDFNDGRLVKGGQTLAAYPVTLETQPVFVRGGAILPMYPETLYSTQVPKDTLTFNIFPDGASEYTVYEDDGESRAYARGEWTRQTIRVEAPAAGRAGDVAIRLDGVTGQGYAGQPKTRAYEFWVHTHAKPSQVLVDGREVLALTATGDAAKRLYKNAQECWFYDENDLGGTVKIKLPARCVKQPVSLVVNTPAADQPELFVPYPQPPAELLERAKMAAQAETRFIAKMNAQDLYQYINGTYTLTLDGVWKRVSGAVVCSNDTDEQARVTFRITTEAGETIFERVGQKGKDAPQIVEVNIPESAKSLTFTLVKDGDGPNVPTLGVWKNLKLVR